MPVYFVTGKLGSGKSLIAVRRIQEYMLQGRPIATNIDLNLDYLCAPHNKTSRVIRLPDKPTADDMSGLGRAYIGDYDENKFGLIALDELGTWLNSRSWNDPTRKAFIDWLIHARKLGWDILFLVQNISMVDKQVQDALCEYLVVCKRTDRISVAGIKLPKVHIASVYYGSSDQPQLLESKWRYRGTDLYSAYDTAQSFSPFYDRGNYCLLPPGYYNQLSQKEIKKEKLKLMLLRSSPIFGLAFIALIIIGYFSWKNNLDDRSHAQQVEVNPVLQATFADTLGNFDYLGSMKFGSQIEHLFFHTQYGTLNSVDLQAMGGTLKSVASCIANIQWSDGSTTIARCEKGGHVDAPKPKGLLGL